MMTKYIFLLLFFLPLTLMGQRPDKDTSYIEIVVGVADTSYYIVNVEQWLNTSGEIVDENSFRKFLGKDSMSVIKHCFNETKKVIEQEAYHAQRVINYGQYGKLPPEATSLNDFTGLAYWRWATEQYKGRLLGSYYLKVGPTIYEASIVEGPGGSLRLGVEGVGDYLVIVGTDERFTVLNFEPENVTFYYSKDILRVNDLYAVYRPVLDNRFVLARKKQ